MSVSQEAVDRNTVDSNLNERAPIKPARLTLFASWLVYLVPIPGVSTVLGLRDPHKSGRRKGDRKL